MTIMPTYITIGELTRRGLSSPLRPTGEPGIWHHHILGTDITETVYDPRWRLVGDLPKQLVQVAPRRAALGQTPSVNLSLAQRQAQPNSFWQTHGWGIVIYGILGATALAGGAVGYWLRGRVRANRRR